MISKYSLFYSCFKKKKCINPFRVSSHVLAERVFQPKGGFSHLKTVSPYCWFAHQPRRSFSTLAPPPFFHSKNHNILPVKTFPLGSPDDWAEEAEAAHWPPWPRPPHEHQPPAACLKVNVARLTAIIIMIIIRSVFVGSTSDCVTRQTLLRGGKKNVSATYVPLGEVQCYLGKLLAVPGEGGGGGDGEGRRRGRWEMKMEEEAESSPHGRNVAPSASRGWEAKSSGFRSRRTPSSALQAWMSSSSEPHYQYTKGQSLLLRENSSRVAFLLSLVRIQASVLHQQTQVTNAEGVFLCLFVCF